MKLTRLPRYVGVDAQQVDLRLALQEGDEDVFAALRAALNKDNLVRIRAQELSPEEFLGVAAKFGPLRSLRRASSQGAHLEDHPEIKVVSNGHAHDGGKLGDGDAAENAWHTDGTYLAAPTILTFLYGRVSPPSPPSTIFLDLAEAYRRLPRELRTRLEGRSAIHYSPFNHDDEHEELVRSLSDPRERKRIGYWRPLIIRNPGSGERSIMPPRQRDCVIEGLSDEESFDLAGALWDFLEALDCKWGAPIMASYLVFWDNRYSLHMREAFPSHQVRVLWHTTTMGDALTSFSV